MDVRTFKESRGYTLIETLVAMTIFLTVVMFLGSLLGDVLLKADTSHERQALLIAQSEITRMTLNKKDLMQEESVDGFRIVRQSELREGLQLVTVTVSRVGSNADKGVRLHKVVATK